MPAFAVAPRANATSFSTSRCSYARRESNAPASAAAAADRKAAGAAILRLNSSSQSSRDAAMAAFKRCLDKAAQEVFQGDATVQAQGSVRKGTGVKGLADWDFMVRLNDNLPTVTKAQRMQFVRATKAAMASAGISYRVQPGENRVRFDQGCMAGQGRLLDADLIFQRFRADERLPPNPKALAHSHNGQKAVQYLKALPSKYTNLRAPKGMYVEDAVELAAAYLRHNKGAQPRDLTAGSHGFHALLTAVLEGVAGRDAGLAQQSVFRQKLAKAGMDSSEWRSVAARVLNQHAVTKQWPFPELLR